MAQLTRFEIQEYKIACDENKLAGLLCPKCNTKVYKLRDAKFRSCECSNAWIDTTNVYTSYGYQSTPPKLLVKKDPQE